MSSQASRLDDSRGPQGEVDESPSPSLRDRVRQAVDGAAERILPSVTQLPEAEPQDDEELTGEVADVLYRIGSEVRRVVREESTRPSGDWRIFALGLVIGVVTTVTVAAGVIWAIISLRGAL